MDVYGDIARVSDGKSAFEDLNSGGGGGFTPIVKAADEPRTNNAVLAADNTLKVTLGVGAWRIRIQAMLKTANATMDYKYATVHTGTSTVKWIRRIHTVAGVAAGTDAETVTFGEAHAPSTAVTATSTGLAFIEINMVVVVTVSGEFQLQWAQNTGDAGALTMLEGSSLEYIAA